MKQVTILTAILITQISISFGQAKIYWAEAGASPKIMTADTSGQNVQILVSSGLTFPCGVALDEVNNKLYWTDKGAGKIQSSDLDGSNVIDVVTGLNEPYGIAIDNSSNQIYWTDMAAGKIQKSDFDGANVQTVKNNLDIPLGISIDTANQKLYWIEQGSGEFNKSEMDGTGTTLIQATIPGYFEDFNGGIALDGNDNRTFLTCTDGDWNWNGDLFRISTNSNNFVTIDANANRLYLTDTVSNRIIAFNATFSGISNLTTVVALAENPQGIAVTQSVPTGIMESKLTQKTKIVPNPMIEKSYISFSNQSGISQWILYNNLGQELQQKSDITSKEFEISKGNLKSGMYFYQISFNDGTKESGKLIIE